MKIQKINENKIRVIFDCEELEQNHISIHSFLSKSKESKILIENLIHKAEKEFKFPINSEIDYDLFSFCNKVFILVITKQKKNPFDEYDSNYIFLKFDNINDFFEFSELIKYYTDTQELYCSFFRLKNFYYLRINLNKKNDLWKRSFISIISEFKSPIFLNSISTAYFNENAISFKDFGDSF
jgi:negative regulator of genetic competence, sporulation and motility